MQNLTTTTVGKYIHYLQRGVLLLLCWTKCRSTWGTIHTLLNDSTVSLVLHIQFWINVGTWVSSDINVWRIYLYCRGALHIPTALDIIPYYVGLNYTCSSMTTWVSLNYGRISFINVGRYYKLSYSHERGASARRLDNLC